MDRIVPGDDFPSAWDAGCSDFLRLLLAQDLASPDVYRHGLESLERESQAVFHREFSGLSAEEQDDLLASVEVGSVVTPWDVSPGLFFKNLVQHTMEGYYGDARNGGSSASEAWRMIGFEVTG
jgi:gluconate 2-dehydrogenase gamma chain